eukprot:GILI01017883.1.p1 GENE.GILI01017883.1~~GILI01017883.1.p1  ORF type:complete len:213 (+),score=48.31 GILI01017883.1:174-812(+)
MKPPQPQQESKDLLSILESYGSAQKLRQLIVGEESVEAKRASTVKIHTRVSILLGILSFIQIFVALAAPYQTDLIFGIFAAIALGISSILGGISGFFYKATPLLWTLVINIWVLFQLTQLLNLEFRFWYISNTYCKELMYSQGPPDVQSYLNGGNCDVFQRNSAFKVAIIGLILALLVWHQYITVRVREFIHDIETEHGIKRALEKKLIGSK